MLLSTPDKRNKRASVGATEATNEENHTARGYIYTSYTNKQVIDKLCNFAYFINFRADLLQI
jgi:hypothetical protein